MYLARKTLKVLLASIIGMSLLCITTGSVFALTTRETLLTHARVLSSDPAIGSTITAGPTKVTVTTSENMNPDPSKTNLFVCGPDADATNTLIGVGNAQVALSNPKTMSVSIKPDSAHINGVYVVVWKIVSSEDGDAATEVYSFTVNTSGTSASTPVPTPATAAPTSTSTTNNASSGIPVWLFVVSIIVALIVGLGADLVLVGRRRGPATATSTASMCRAIVEDLEKEKSDRLS